MVDAVFAVAFAALLIAIVAVLRSPASAAVLVALGITGSGVLLQFIATNGVNVRLDALQWWLAITLVVLLAVAIAMRRREPVRVARSALLLVCGSSIVVALGLLAFRALAPGSPGPLTGVGYLISRSSAEDNAKWLNAAAELASGDVVNAWPNVGGPLLLLMTLSATLVSAASVLLYGGVNEVAVSVGTLITSEMAMIAVAPFAVAPLVESRIRRSRDGRPSRIPWPPLLASIIIVTAAMCLLLYFGHLTLQFTILILTLWVCAFIAWRRKGAALVATTLAVAMTAEVWFPLNVVALGLLVGLVALGVIAMIRRQRMRDAAIVTATALVVLVLMYDFLRSSIEYSLGTSGGQVSTVAASIGGAVRGVVALALPSLPLFSQPGGTEVVTALFGAITVAAAVAALVVLRDSGGRRYLLRFAPIAILTAYTLLVTLADYWAVGKGPGYATNKLTFAIAVPILTATLPVGLLLLDRGQRGMTSLRWFALAGVVMLLVLDTFLPRALIQLKPSLWPTTSGDPQPYWWPAEVRDTADQPLSSNPVACIYLPQGAERPSVLPDGQRAYSCTRLLTGIAGQDDEGAGIVQWTLDEWLSNESLWDHYQAYFAGMPQSARDRDVILLDLDSKVVGIETLQYLMDRYPAETDASG